MATTDEPRRAPLPPGEHTVHARLAANLAAVDARIERAARAAGRSDRPRLVAVTKTVGADVARVLVELGRRDLGENRIQVLDPKWRALCESPAHNKQGDALHPRWHFIGHVQRNKAAAVAERCDAVHSVDSLRLLAALGEAARAAGRLLEVYLQIKLWPEEDKGGFAPIEVDAALDALAGESALVPAGFMTMAPLLDELAAPAAAREVFTKLADLARLHSARPWLHGRPLLSMGMSDDLELAVAAGSDWLRIGRALFTGLDRSGADALNGSDRHV